MNLIKALEGLSVKPDKTEAEELQTSTPPKTADSAPPETVPDIPNVMAGVIERHERISNRVRGNARTK